MDEDSQTEWVPQFEDDTETWIDLISKEMDPASRIMLYRSAPDMLLGEIMRYGVLNDADTIDGLKSLYSCLMRNGMPLPLRRKIYEHVAHSQQRSNVFSGNIYLPFITCELDRVVCSTAVIDYVSMGQLTDNDPMSRVKDVTSMITEEAPVNRGAAFGGLLYLGDRRVCRLLLPLREGLSDREVQEAILCFTGFVHAATIDFLLDWIEEIGDDADGTLFGIIASGLVFSRRNMIAPFVSTGERPFPVTSVTLEESRRMHRHISIEEYTARIAPRLYAVERAEPEPKVMPHVLAAWGLAPPPGQA